MIQSLGINPSSVVCVKINKEFFDVVQDSVEKYAFDRFGNKPYRRSLFPRTPTNENEREICQHEHKMQQVRREALFQRPSGLWEKQGR